MIHMGDEFSRLGKVFNVGERLYTPTDKIKFKDEHGKVHVGSGYQLADGTFSITVGKQTKMVLPERVIA